MQPHNNDADENDEHENDDDDDGDDDNHLDADWKRHLNFY